MKYQTIFLDIDGTILKPDHSMEQSTKFAIDEAKKRGLNVVLATGRPLHEIGWLLEELDINSAIAYNGALIKYKNSIIYKKTINPAVLQKIIHIAEELGNEIVMYTDSKTYVTNDASEMVKEFLSGIQLNSDGRYQEEILKDILGLSIITKKDSEHTHYQGFTGIKLSQINVEGLSHCYDVTGNTINKGEAIKFLLEYTGTPAENTIAIGDGANDKEMLSSVGVGVAMGNCHSELVKYAKHITTDVNNSGVFNALQTLGVL